MCDFDGRKGNIIREKPSVNSFKVDEIITQLMDSCKNKAIKLEWKQRSEKLKKIQESKQLGTLSIDSKVDVRDKDYIWCEGTVKLIIEQINKDPLYVIHYEGMSHQWDEIIYKNSGRLAKHQTYTGLEYVPRYKVNADKSIVCVENQILVATATLSNKELTPIVSGLQSNEPE